MTTMTASTMTTMTTESKAPEVHHWIYSFLNPRSNDSDNCVIRFNSEAIVFDNTPWRPGRVLDISKQSEDEENERKLKNLATRVMSNGVEVLVKDKNRDQEKHEQRRVKRRYRPSSSSRHINSSKSNPSLLSSAVTTFTNQHQFNIMFPLRKLLNHNYIIKTCLTTFTYLTTVLHNKKSAVSTFETTISVVTTESLTNLFATDLLPAIQPTRTKYLEVKTIQPTAVQNVMFKSQLPKLEKRVDDEVENLSFDLIQPSEPGHTPCLSSCPCSHQQTEGLKTKYDHEGLRKPQLKTDNYGASKIDIRPSHKQSHDKSQEPYHYENNKPQAPTDRVVEKYTEVVNDYADEKEHKVRVSELLTNEQAPGPPKSTKTGTKTDKVKTEKPHKPPKNKFMVADLLKLGSLGIKGLSQLAPVFEKMTGGLIKRHDVNRTTTTTSTDKAITELTAYNVNKRIDSEGESKHSNFPIYIPVDELETSESQTSYTNVSLRQNLGWANYKHSKAQNILPPKFVHESPLVNGGIPISPGEIITANSDVIVGKPAVGGPLTLAASGMKYQNSVKLPPIDSFVSSNDQYTVREPLPTKDVHPTRVDDSYDLRPPVQPIQKPPNSANGKTRPQSPKSHHSHQHNLYKTQVRPTNVYKHGTENVMKTEQIKASSILGNHGRPAFLDYIPSFGKPSSSPRPIPISEPNDVLDIPDNSASSSELVDTRVNINGERIHNSNQGNSNKPLLIDIQPSKVANVLIPHGSSTALVFSGSSEPHKTGDYVDDPLPYAEPGYFGSFSIDAPQSTYVHASPTNNKPLSSNIPQSANNHYNQPPNKGQSQRNNLKSKWKDPNTFKDFNRLPPPTSNQEKHVQIGPQITVYNPDIYKPTNGNGDFEKYNNNKNNKHKNKHLKNTKETIDNEYENYLAVPPPPPPKVPYYQESNHEKNKFAGQKPIIHTKPIQDMKVFLNIQHPIPQPQPHLVMNQGEVPPKVTSEIYFAAQQIPNVASPSYNIHIPSNSKPQNNYWHKVVDNDQAQNTPHYGSTDNSSSNNDAFYPSQEPNTNSYDSNNSQNMYTVTLNTATNVAGNVGNSGQIVGSSIPVSVGNGENTNIPVGTNFAIKVEDDSSSQIEQSERTPINYNKNSQSGNTKIEDNRWNVSYPVNSNFNNKNEYEDQYKPIASTQRPTLITVNAPASSFNSHANFPMLNQYETIKPVTEYIEDVKPEVKRPPKVVNSINSNSHGWYSSVPLNEVKNIDIDTTTRKAIPLVHDHTKHKLPNFGEKIHDAGKPPIESWQQNSGPALNLGRPFSKPQATENKSVRPETPTKNEFFSANYIPHNYDIIRQPVYDIPIRDNSDETTTTKVTSTTKAPKVVYENAYEVYDGEQDSSQENDQEHDGEISSESMKVPIVSLSDKKYNTINRDTKTTTTEKPEVTTTRKEIFVSRNSSTVTQKSPIETQTEKQFNEESYNRTIHYQSNELKPIYDHNSHMRPKPFAAESNILDHQLQQPHLQINQLVENSTNMSYDDNFDGIDLNIGEEISTQKTTKPTTIRNIHKYKENDNQYKTIIRPIFSLKNNSFPRNDSSIITSTVHITDKKPLHVVDSTRDSSSTLPTFTITSTDFSFNQSLNEIIDLSPPPPTTNDYNFKPTTKEETIMGMSPPPPESPVPPSKPTRAPLTPRPLPIRTPPPFRAKPPTRTPAPRIPPQRPTRKPIIRDEISTYRPVYDFSNIKKPNYHRDSPSSHMLPPPRDLPSKITPIYEPSPSSVQQVPPNVVFPTPISSGWLTSSGVDFSEYSYFAPSSVQILPVSSKIDEPSTSSTEKINYYDNQDSTERHENKLSSEKTDETTDSKESSSETKETVLTSNEESNESSAATSNEDTSTEKNKFVRNKNRTRKPYPPRDDILKASASNKYKITKPSIAIKPTRTLNHPDILYSTRHLPVRKPVIPIMPPRIPPITVKPNVIESSETFIHDEYAKPTDIITEKQQTPDQISDDKPVVEKTPILSDSTILQNQNNSSVVIKPTYYVRDENKQSEEVVPTKTEYKTTVVTLTKTLFEPPQTSYSNINHTLTVTKTQTSLISQSEGAATETLVLTNTYISTVVDVVTEIKTQIQPTTIVETVTKHIPIPQVAPTPVQELGAKTKLALDDVTLSSEETDNLIIRDEPTTQNIQKIDQHMEGDNDTFFVVINKSQNGGMSPPVTTDIETSDYDGITRNEEVNNNGVSQVLFGEILLAGTPYLETANVAHPTGVAYGKECQPDCKASRNERCQRIDGVMKCVCRPGFARMFPDRPCKPTYTYSVKLALSSQGKEKLRFHENLSDNSSKQYHALALATHEGINRMIMQSDLRDVYHGVHITGFQPVQVPSRNDRSYQGVLNYFYVQLSDNAHESRLKEVIEKYLRNNNYSLGGTDVYAAGELVDRLDVTDFDECTSGTFNDCSEHAQCFNLRGTYTCSCLEGFADLSVNSLYPGRICSSEPVGCERCNYHGSCYSRDDQRVLCECFQWYAGSTCHINLKVVLISLVTLGALLTIVLVICAVVACHKRPRPQQQRSIVACIQSIPSIHQSGVPSKQRQDRRALINERADSGDASSLQNTSLPYIPSKKTSNAKKMMIADPPAHAPPPPPPDQAVMIPRARLHPTHRDSRDMASRKQSMEVCTEEKLISYLESGTNGPNEEMMRRKHSVDSSSYSAQKERHNKQGALVSAGFKVSTTIRNEDMCMKVDRDDLSSIHKHDIETEMERYGSLRKTYSRGNISEWTDAERRLGELTLSEARSVGGTLPASTGRAASSTRLTHQEANTMAERDLGSTFLLPHVHLYKPDVTSDVSEFDSL